MFDQEIIIITNILLEATSKIKIDNNICFVNDRELYNVGNDSKLISKIYEIIVIKKLTDIFLDNNFKFIENKAQNKYPDCMVQSRIDISKYYAIDVKTSYVIQKNRIHGFTLGTYNGYFRKRDQYHQSIIKPYNDFIKHLCICIIYIKNQASIEVTNLIVSEKWKLASKSVGSGNTCNIGSIKNIDDILNKKNCFHSEDEFNSYWVHK